MINKAELIIWHSKFCDEACDIAVQRGDEYANQEDELKTFRTAAELYGCKPSDVARMLICLKVARMQNNKKRDTKLDLINFIVYLDILEQDEL